MVKHNGTLSAQHKSAVQKITDQQEFSHWFGKSQARDSSGQPMVMFHASPKEFDIEQANPLSHFGTCQAAQDIGQRLCGNKYITYPAFLSIQNPIRIPDTGGHSGSFYRLIFEKILPEGSGQTILDKNEIDYVFGKETLKDFIPFSRFIFPERHAAQNKWAERMIETLSKKGFDGFVYENRMEDTGSTSFIIFDTKQIRSALRQPDATFTPLHSSHSQDAKKSAPIEASQKPRI